MAHILQPEQLSVEMENRGGTKLIEFFKGKSLLITGSTGFLAKIFVEKLLRVHKVKRMYLLIRATDTKAAMQRLRGDYAFHDQILDKEVFSVLKEKHGSGFQSFVRSKLQPVGGDIGHENLGIRDPDQRQNLFEEEQIIVHVAATTNFYER